MTYFNKLNFIKFVQSEETHTEYDLSRFMKSDSVYPLIGSVYKPLRFSEHKEKCAQIVKLNRIHGFNLNQIVIPGKESVFTNQFRILITKMKIFVDLAEEYGLQIKYDLGEVLLGTLQEGFKFNDSYKKKIDSETRSYLKGETERVYQNFPASHLLPWLDEDPIEKAYVFDDPVRIVQKELNRVVSVMHRNITDNALIRDIDLIDGLYLINNKKVNHLDEKGRTKTSAQVRGESLDISFPKDNSLDFIMKKVTTDACTSRSAGIATIQGRNLIYSAHSNLDLVTDAGHDLYKAGIEAKTWQNKLSPGEGTHFIMIDFKKSGLTTNREVIKSVYKTALEHYPGFRPWATYLDCLENVSMNGTKTKRGTSLGMDDNAISFFLASAWEAWLEHHEYFREFILFANFKGDDQIISVKGDRNFTNRVFRSWIKSLSRLGFLVNAKKSFIGVRGQFCEIVGKGDHIDTKTIEFALNCFDCLGAYNIVDFKIRVNALTRAFNSFDRYSKIFEFCISTVIRLVEPEFSPQEIHAPFEMGGYFSYFYRSLNTFLVEMLETKFDEFDRRLFNLIGSNLPEASFNYKKVKKVIKDEFEDVQNLLNKLRRISSDPMSKNWRYAYDSCLRNRYELFTGPILSKGSRIQTLLDSKEKYVPPPELLYIDNSESKFILKKYYKRHYKAKKSQNRPYRLVNQFKKNFFYIDEIRAKLLLRSAEKGNEYLINFYREPPISTLVWSIAKRIAYSKYAIPIAWADYINTTSIRVEDLWTYYRDRDINLYHIQPPRIVVKDSIVGLFRGYENSDSIMFCPITGFPIGFNSIYCEIHHIERKKEIEEFFEHIMPRFYPEWQSIELLEQWYGLSWRNASEDLLSRVYIAENPPEYLERMEHYPGIEYCPDGVDPEVFFWYFDHYLDVTNIQVENVHVEPEELDLDIYVLPRYKDDESDISYEAAHDSDSDIIEGFFKENFLDSDTDQENDPYVNLSSDSDKELED